MWLIMDGEIPLFEKKKTMMMTMVMVMHGFERRRSQELVDVHGFAFACVRAFVRLFIPIDTTVRQTQTCRVLLL